jgi:hypothetical protein
VIAAVPRAIAETMPEPAPIDAIPGFPLLHVPPAKGLLNVVVVPRQIVVMPIMGGAVLVAFTIFVV